MKRFTLLATMTLSSGALALVAIACSDDDNKTPVSANPTPGGSSSGGSSSSGTTSSSGSSSGGQPDTGASSSSGGSAACAPIKNDVDILTIPAARTETGGTIPDGTYDLTAARRLTAGGDGGATGKKKGATLVFAGANVAWQFNANTIGDPTNQCCVGTYTVVGAAMKMLVKCVGTDTVFEPSYSVVTDGGAPEVLLQLGQSNDTYTKQ